MGDPRPTRRDIRAQPEPSGSIYGAVTPPCASSCWCWQHDISSMKLPGDPANICRADDSRFPTLMRELAAERVKAGHDVDMVVHDLACDIRSLRWKVNNRGTGAMSLCALHPGRQHGRFWWIGFFMGRQRAYPDRRESRATTTTPTFTPLQVASSEGDQQARSGDRFGRPSSWRRPGMRPLGWWRTEGLDDARFWAIHAHLGSPGFAAFAAGRRRSRQAVTSATTCFCPSRNRRPRARRQRGRCSAGRCCRRK